MASWLTAERIGKRVIPGFLKPTLLRLWYLYQHHSLRLRAGVQLDAYCWFGEGVRLGVGAHASHSFVGDHSYLARGASLFYASIGKYCSIGHGAIVGAGSVATHDVAEYAVVAGVPVHTLRFRFSPEEIQELLYACWWDWSDTELSRVAALFSDPVAFFAMLTHWGKLSQ